MSSNTDMVIPSPRPLTSATLYEEKPPPQPLRQPSLPPPQPSLPLLQLVTEQATTEPEIRTIVDCSNDLETALSDVGEDLIRAFNSNGLISDTLCCNLLDQSSWISKWKGKWIMKSIEGKVMESHCYFAIFVYQLRQAGHQYQNVVNKLDEVYFQHIIKKYLHSTSLGSVRANTSKEGN